MIRFIKHILNYWKDRTYTLKIYGADNRPLFIQYNIKKLDDIGHYLIPGAAVKVEIKKES